MVFGGKPKVWMPLAYFWAGLHSIERITVIKYPIGEHTHMGPHGFKINAGGEEFRYKFHNPS